MTPRQLARVGTLATLFTVLLAPHLPAQRARPQDRRQVLVDSARAMLATSNERGALPVLRRAVDPALADLNETWATAVALLAQALIGVNEGDEAQTWLRWALRLSPNARMQSGDSATTAAVSAARTLVAAQGGDGRAALRFEWSTAPTTPGLGALRLDPGEGNLTGQLQAEVEGVGFLDPSRPRRLSGGTYLVSLRAPGVAGTRINTEVLPGVTTVLAPSLLTTIAATPTAAPTPPAIAVPASPKKGRGKFILLGGLAAGGIVAALSSGGGGEKPTTGGITIRLP